MYIYTYIYMVFQGLFLERVDDACLYYVPVCIFVLVWLPSYKVGSAHVPDQQKYTLMLHSLDLSVA